MYVKLQCLQTSDASSRAITCDWMFSRTCATCVRFRADCWKSTASGSDLGVSFAGVGFGDSFFDFFGDDLAARSLRAGDDMDERLFYTLQRVCQKSEASTGRAPCMRYGTKSWRHAISNEMNTLSRKTDPS